MIKSISIWAFPGGIEGTLDPAAAIGPRQVRAGDLRAWHFRRLPGQIALEQLLNRLAQLRYDHIGQAHLFPQFQQLRQAKTRVGPYAS